MIDHQTENLMSFSQAARHLPRSYTGRNLHPNTVARWTREGISGVVLETIKIGRRRFTSAEACQRFFEALTTATSPPISSSSLSPEAQARSAAECLELERMGI
jgi:hypothetical protein